MSWNTMSLGEICEVLNGYAFKSDNYTNKGHRVIRITNVQKGSISDNDPKFYNEDANLEKFNLFDDDLLISLTGNVGRVGRISKELLPAYLNQRVGCIRVKKNVKISKSYLYYFFNQDSFERLCINNSQGVAQKNLSTDWLRTVRIPLPPLETQKKIADVLDKAQELIDKRKEQIEKLDEFVKNLFLNMFGDPVRNKMGFQISSLSAFITHMTSGGRGWAKYYSSEGDRFIRSLDVQMNRISDEEVVYVNPPMGKEAERTRVETGDVLLTITGSRIGRVAYVTPNFGVGYVSQHVAIIRTQGINPTYLSFYLSMPNAGQLFISQQQYGQTKPGLNFKQIESFPILNPPLDLQNKFAQIFEKTEQQKALMQKSLNEMENNFNSIMQKAFRGELF